MKARSLVRKSIIPLLMLPAALFLGGCEEDLVFDWESLASEADGWYSDYDDYDLTSGVSFDLSDDLNIGADFLAEMTFDNSSSTNYDFILDNQEVGFIFEIDFDQDSSFDMYLQGTYDISNDSYMFSAGVDYQIPNGVLDSTALGNLSQDMDVNIQLEATSNNQLEIGVSIGF